MPTFLLSICQHFQFQIIFFFLWKWNGSALRPSSEQLISKGLLDWTFLLPYSFPSSWTGVVWSTSCVTVEVKVLETESSFWNDMVVFQEQGNVGVPHFTEPGRLAFPCLCQHPFALIGGRPGWSGWDAVPWKAGAQGISTAAPEQWNLVGAPRAVTLDPHPAEGMCQAFQTFSRPEEQRLGPAGPAKSVAYISGDGEI